MNRRNFLQALGIGGGASALSACGLDNNRYYTPVENVVPYVNRPDQIVPGTATYFATSVHTGPNAYPTLAIHREGRVVNVGGNHKAPVLGGVSRYAFFEVQRHYSPDRLRSPKAAGQDVTWEAARGQLADLVKSARAAGKKVAYLGGYKGPTLAKLIDTFTAGEAVFWEPLGREAEARAAELMFGQRILPRYDLSGAHYVLSFGADFLGGQWGGQWSQGEFARARKPVDGFVSRFALVSPHRDQTGANADDWYACAPGSEALVARAVAKLVADKKGYTGAAAAWLADADPAAAASAAGLDVSALEAMAATFAAAPAIALPGGVAGATASATELALAVYLLNVVSDAPGFGLGGFTGPVHGIARVERLLADAAAGQIGVLLLDEHVNPLFSLPADAKVAEAFGKVSLVSLSSHPDESSSTAALVLPCADVFEDWGDEEPVTGFHIVRQPAGVSLYDALSLGDVLLSTWRALDPSAPAGTWREWVQRRWMSEVLATPVVDALSGAAPGAESAAATGMPAAADPAATPVAAPAPPSAALQRQWEQVLSDGFFARPAFGQRVVPVVTGAPVAFTGVAAMTGSGEYALHLFPHAFLADGRYSNQPWAQEVPDPLTGHVWDSWVHVHPDTAAKLGVKDGDLLEITTATGKFQVGVEISPAGRPDVLAVPFGQGHADASGRYAKAGVNPVTALSVTKDAHGSMAWQQAKVSATAVGAQSDVWSTFGGDSDLDRKFVGLVSAEQLAGGDAPHGETRFAGPMLLDFHDAPWDARLEKAGLFDMYGAPEHPNYRFGLSIDTNACTGCGACAIACYSENNLPVVGKTKVREGREMGWLRVNRYWKPRRDDEGNVDPSQMEAGFVPMMCQHCAHAPCESVCPVLATYHTIDGLNAMVYNRCVGTRYCSNACPFSARKFNYHSYQWPEPFNLMLNPDVSTRTMGVMEKCTFCVQRIRRTKIAWKDRGHTDLVADSELTRLTACADACPSGAITFGNLNDAEAHVTQQRRSARSYYPLPETNVFPAVNYLGRATFHRKPAAHHGGGHGDGHAAAGGAHEGGAEAHGAEAEPHGNEPAAAPAGH